MTAKQLHAWRKLMSGQTVWACGHAWSARRVTNRAGGYAWTQIDLTTGDGQRHLTSFWGAHALACYRAARALAGAL